jgi:hypothetical protein
VRIGRSDKFSSVFRPDWSPDERRRAGSEPRKRLPLGRNHVSAQLAQPRNIIGGLLISTAPGPPVLCWGRRHRRPRWAFGLAITAVVLTEMSSSARRR